MRIALLLLVATCAGACGRSAGAGATAPDAGESSCLAQVTAVYDTTPLARRVDGTIWVALDRARFTEVAGPSGHFRASDLAVSGSTAYGTAIACVIEDGAVWCFPLAGPLLDGTDLGAGLGPGAMTTGPVRVVTDTGAPLAGARQLAATMNGGGAAFCAVTDVGGLFCWGYGLTYILGRGDFADANVARPVLRDLQNPPLDDVAEVRLGYDSACARKNDGTVLCWGDDSVGQVGSPPPGDTANAPFPTEVALPEPATRLAADPGRTHCAVLASGHVACWGWNAFKQASEGTGADSAPPTIVMAPDGTPFSGVVDLAPDRGMQAMCATTTDGSLWCWGHLFLDTGTEGTRELVTQWPTRGVDRLRAPIRLPLAAYGARDGALVFVDARGRLTLSAGGMPFVAQPPCD